MLIADGVDEAGADGAEAAVLEVCSAVGVLLDSNPFEEPEDAPELKESRSANVTQHVGDFWNTPENGYQRIALSSPIKEGESRSKTAKRKAQGRSL